VVSGLRNLIVYRTGKKWFAHVIEVSAGRKELRRIEIPQTVDEIEALARREGFEIEWDGPEPQRQLWSSAT
jgi:hypothetical protein